MLTIEPSTIKKGEKALITVALPATEDITCDVRVTRNATGIVVSMQPLVIDLDDPTVGLPGQPTEYRVECLGPVRIEQTGPTTFTAEYDPTVTPIPHDHP